MKKAQQEHGTVDRKESFFSKTQENKSLKLLVKDSFEKEKKHV